MLNRLFEKFRLRCTVESSTHINKKKLHKYSILIFGCVSISYRWIGSCSKVLSWYWSHRAPCLSQWIPATRDGQNFPTTSRWTETLDRNLDSFVIKHWLKAYSVVVIVRPIAHADDSRENKAIISVCVCVCPHNKTQTTESTIAKLVIEIVHQEPSPST